LLRNNVSAVVSHYSLSWEWKIWLCWIPHMNSCSWYIWRNRWQWWLHFWYKKNNS